MNIQRNFLSDRMFAPENRRLFEEGFKAQELRFGIESPQGADPKNPEWKTVLKPLEEKIAALDASDGNNVFSAKDLKVYLEQNFAKTKESIRSAQLKDGADPKKIEEILKNIDECIRTNIGAMQPGMEVARNDYAFLEKLWKLIGELEQKVNEHASVQNLNLPETTGAITEVQSHSRVAPVAEFQAAPLVEAKIENSFIAKAHEKSVDVHFVQSLVDIGILDDHIGFSPEVVMEVIVRQEGEFSNAFPQFALRENGKYSPEFLAYCFERYRFTPQLTGENKIFNEILFQKWISMYFGDNASMQERATVMFRKQVGVEKTYLEDRSERDRDNAEWRLDQQTSFSDFMKDIDFQKDAIYKVAESILETLPKTDHLVNIRSLSYQGVNFLDCPVSETNEPYIHVKAAKDLIAFALACAKITGKPLTLASVYRNPKKQKQMQDEYNASLKSQKAETRSNIDRLSIRVKELRSQSPLNNKEIQKAEKEKKKFDIELKKLDNQLKMVADPYLSGHNSGFSIDLKDHIYTSLQFLEKDYQGDAEDAEEDTLNNVRSLAGNFRFYPFEQGKWRKAEPWHFDHEELPTNLKERRSLAQLIEKGKKPIIAMAGSKKKFG